MGIIQKIIGGEKNNTSSVGKQTGGYEVIRNGQGMSVSSGYVKDTDIMLKKVTPWSSGGGGGGSGNSASQPSQPMTTIDNPTPSAEITTTNPSMASNQMATPQQTVSYPTNSTMQLRQNLGIYGKGMTELQEKAVYNNYVMNLRKSAGTYGQDLNPLAEEKILKEYQTTPQQQQEIYYNQEGYPTLQQVIQPPTTALTKYLPISQNVNRQKYISMPTTFQRFQTKVAQKTGVYIPSGKELYQDLFRSNQPPEQRVEPITFRRASGDIGETFAGLVNTAGQGTGELFYQTRKAIPYQYYQKIPEKIIPQRVTAGGEFKIPEQRIDISITPQQARTAGDFLGSTAALIGAEVATAPAVLAGLYTAAATSPREMSANERLNYGLMAGLSATPLFAKAVSKLVPKSSLLVEEEIIKTVPKEQKVMFGTPNVRVLETPTGEILEKTTYPVTATERTQGFGRNVKVYEKTKTDNFLENFGIKRQSKEIYSGSPYTELGKKQYPKTIEKLQSYGYDKKQARAAIRQVQPKIEDIKFEGGGSVVRGINEEPLIGVVGKTTIKPKVADFGNVKSLNFEQQVLATNQPGIKLSDIKEVEYYKSSPEVNRMFISNDNGIYQKPSQLGRTTQKFSQVSRVKQIGNTEIGLPTEFDISVGVRPSDIAKSLQKKGELVFLEPNSAQWKELGGGKLPSNELGEHSTIIGKFSNMPKADTVIIVRDQKEIGKLAYEKKVLHELTHRTTEGWFDKSENLLPYSRRPSELVAKEMEKYVTNEGFVKGSNNPLNLIVTKKAPANIYKEQSITREFLESGNLGRPKVSRSTIIQLEGEPRSTVYVESPFKITKLKEIGKPRTKDQINADIIKNSKDILKTFRDIYGKPSKEQVAAEVKSIASLIPKVSNSVKQAPINFKLPKIVSKAASQEEFVIPKLKTNVVNIPQESTSRFADMTGSSRFSSQTPSGFGDLGSMNSGRLGTTDEVINLPKLKTNEGSKVINIPKIKNKFSLGNPSSESNANKNKTIEITSPVERLVPGLKNPAAEKPTEAQKPVERLIPKLNERLKYNQPQIPRLAPKLDTGFKTPAIPVVPTATAFPRPKTLVQGIKSSSKPIRTRDSFSVELRRFGKFKTVASGFKDPLKAQKVGEVQARQTLGASFRVKGSKGYVGLKPSSEFRFGKAGKDSTILIQRANARLGSLSERRAIIASRNKGGLLGL